MALRRLLGALLIGSLAGLGVSLYLTYTYTQGATIACPDGGCSAVQSSPYAWIAGIPIPTLGALLYLVLIGVIILALRPTQRLAELLLAIFGLSLAGVLFSGYLTYLELFVIHAICTWCVISAVIMVLIFGLALLAYRQHRQLDE